MKRLSFLSILLAICCFFAGCSPFSKHTVANTEEIRTETFLDCPDYLICFTNGKEKQLSPDFAENVYNAFMSLTDALEETDALKTPFQSKYIDEWKREYTCFEFRYNRRRDYAGALKDEKGLFTWGEIRFDAFLFVYYSGGLIAVPYIDGNYFGVNDLFLFLDFPENEMNEFMNVIR